MEKDEKKRNHVPACGSGMRCAAAYAAADAGGESSGSFINRNNQQ